MKKKSFEGRTALVTGASSGIGRALSLALAGEGCRVGLLARRAELLKELEDEIRARGGEALALPADVLKEDEVRAAVEKLAGAWGGVDIAVANAGLGSLHRVAKLNAEKAHRVMDLNFYGAWNLFEAVLPGMLERGSGRLVGISSFASFRGLPKSSVYSASKAALDKLLESARVELRPKGIKCTVIHPGFVHTPLADQNDFKMPFVLEADEAAALIVKIIRQGKAEATFPWQLALIAPLFRNLPNRLFDRIVKGF